MLEADAQILVDTMVVIEAHRIGGWKAMANKYKIETVDQCIQELNTGNMQQNNPVYVDTGSLDIQVNTVNESDRVELRLKCPESANLDPGERDLLAYAMTLSNVFYLCGPDKAFMRVSHLLGLLDNFVPLESLLEGNPSKRRVKRHYTEKWLGEEKTKIKLGVF